MLRASLAASAAVVALLFCAGVASATEDGSSFNNEYTPYNADLSNCVATRSSSGIAAFAFNDTYLPFGIDTANDYCGAGRLRILSLQRLTIGGRTTYMVRGQENQPHVHVSGSDLATTPTLQAHSVRNGNGRAAASCTQTLYAAPSAANLPTDMLYKTTDELGGPGSMWANYGNPGGRWGSTYTHLLWSLPRKGAYGSDVPLAQGGLTMAVLKENQQVTLCDVTQQRLRSFWGNSQNGWVQFAYVRVSNAAETIYGWMMVAYQRDGQPAYFTFRTA
jgi:hypothetical protein